MSSLFFLALHFAPQLLRSQGAPSPQYQFWEYNPVDNLTDFTYLDVEITGSRSRVWGGGYLHQTVATSTIGYHHITLEFELGLSNGDPLNDGEYAELQYSINNSMSWVTEDTFLQSELSTPRSIELPDECDDNDGIRIQFSNTGDDVETDSFYVEIMRLTGTVITSSPTLVPTTNIPTIPINTPTTALPTRIPTTVVPTTAMPTTSMPTQFPSSNPTFAEPTYQRTVVETTNSNNAGVEESTLLNTKSDDNDESTTNADSNNIDNIIYGISGLVLFLLCIIVILLWWYCFKKRNLQILKKQTAYTNDTSELVIGRVKSESVDMNTTQGSDVYSDTNALRIWLNTIKCGQYYDNFVEHGFHQHMAMLSTLKEQDLQNMGIENIKHRTMILSQIENNKNVMKGFVDNHSVRNMDDEDADELYQNINTVSVDNVTTRGLTDGTGNTPIIVPEKKTANDNNSIHSI